MYLFRFARRTCVRSVLLAASLLLIHSAFPPGLHAGTTIDGSRVLVVYRTKGIDADRNGVVDSEQLARYYALKRNVPPANLLPVTISVPYNYYYTGEYTKFYND